MCLPREPLAKGFLGYLISLEEQQERAAQRAAEAKLRDAVLHDQSKASRAGPATVARVSHGSAIARQAHSDEACPRAQVSRARSRSAKYQARHGHTYNIAQAYAQLLSQWMGKQT